MKQVSAAGVCVLCAAIAVACDRNRADEAEVNTAQGATEQREQDEDPISVSGCLTMQNDRYVLTRLEGDADPVAATEVYQLTDADDDLREHVGKVIQVFGEAPPAQVAQVDQSTTTASGTSGQASGSAQVSVRETTRFEATTLDVVSVIPTGRACDEATGAR